MSDVMVAEIMIIVVVILKDHLPQRPHRAHWQAPVLHRAPVFFEPKAPLLLSLPRVTLTLDVRCVLGCLCVDVNCRGVSVQAHRFSPASLWFFRR